MAQELRFPDGFVWGSSTAAYQIEGAVSEGGRGDSIWDVFARVPGKVRNGDSGAVACDHFHRYKEDVQLMKSLGLKHYRFSISWTRILPTGVGAVSEEGVTFYNNLIDELIANDIEPMITLQHFDMPMALQLEFDGWLGGEHIQKAFADYARVCFQRFGDRVKDWLTINEPWIVALFGYGLGMAPPARKHNAHFEPYLAAHNLLLAHARAVQVYRNEFKATQGGRVGFPLVADWRKPKPSEDAEQFKLNEEAAERGRQFVLGWFADPLYFGDYPEIMRQRAGDRLPKFTEEERKILQGSNDFMAINHYSSMYAEPTKEFLTGAQPEGKGSIMFDEGVLATWDEKWVHTDAFWNVVVPDGFGEQLIWLQKRYNPPGGIYVTENGCAWAGQTKEESINDDFRVNFYKGYISHMHKAIQQGADVRGYYTWSTMDNFEWAEGYSKRFGIIYVDYETQERTPKKSARFYSDIICKNAIVVDEP